MNLTAEKRLCAESVALKGDKTNVIEEFDFTSKVLQREKLDNALKDIEDLRNFLRISVTENKNRLADLTWARLTWEQRVTLSTRIAVPTNSKTEYYLAIGSTKRHTYREPIVCETLCQMQF